MVIFSITNLKGGVGKTTTCLNLGYCLAELGKWVLMIDIDPQASLTQALNARGQSRLSMVDVIIEKKPITEITQKIGDRLFLAPSSQDLISAEMRLNARKGGSEYALKEALLYLRYDVCLIDCPPSLSLLAVNSLAAAQWVICPTLPTELDWRSVILFLKSIKEFKNTINRDLDVLGLIVCQYCYWFILHQQIMEKMVASNVRILGTIPRSVKFAEAAGSGLPITCGELAEHYKQIAVEVCKYLRR